MGLAKAIAMPAIDRKSVLKKIRQSVIVPVFGHPDPEVCREIVRACYEGGLRVVEFVHRGPQSAENYIALRHYAQRELPELYIGIGSVKDAETAALYMSYSADFVVSPLVDADMGALCKAQRVLWIPGASTPTEIARAEKAGAEWVKLFPAEALSPAFARAVRALFPGLRFMAADGLEASAGTLLPWLEAGVSAIGLGGGLVGTEMIRTRDFVTLKNNCQKLLKVTRRWRQDQGPER